MALQHIIDAKLNHLTTLSLSFCDLERIPPELGELIWLESLKLSENRKLTEISVLDKLINITNLHLDNNQIQDISLLANLVNLKVLFIDYTQVADLSPLADLVNLTELAISGTRVKDLTPLSNLKNLTKLYFDDTKVCDLTPIANLTKLTKLAFPKTKVKDLSPLTNLGSLNELYIHHTLVRDLRPLRGLIEKGIFVKNYDKLDYHSGIFVKDCPLTNPPMEIVERGNSAILNYWEQIEIQQGTVELYEAKLVIVGEGGTGKTTLFEKLKDASYQIRDTPETHGINIHEGLPFNHINIGENTFYANLWDFGGQDIQYMTHQFFLNPRALYILMMDSRRESPNLPYWFKIINLLGRESEELNERVKLLLVFNKRTNSKGSPQYQDILKFYEDGIDVQFLEVDLAVNDYRFENLINTIQNHLVNLPIVKSQLPCLWKDVREDLRNEAKNENYISTRRFAEICSKYQIEKEEDQWLLSGYLHQLGSLLHFQNDRGLRSWVILKPQWAVDGVYSFLTDENIVNNYGHFKETDFIQLLATKGYSREGADLILQLMTKNNFDICYEASLGRYVAAQLLPNVAPEYSWYPPREMLQFRYQYSIMPKGLMSRLIVRLSDYLEVHPENGKQIVWKKGSVFRIKSREGECRVRLREDDAESKSGLRQILVDVIGDQHARKYALRKIRDEVDDLHYKWFRRLKPAEMVPCCCSECRVSDDPQLYKLENLLIRSTKRKDTSCDSSGEDILIQTLLEGIYDQQEIYNMKRER